MDRLDELRESLRGTAMALAALHRSGAEYGRAMAWDQELAEVREVLERLDHSVPSLSAAAAPLLDRLERLDASARPDPLVSAHHDFRPAQVLLHDGRIGFIDFDGACRAEPALDLGRFRRSSATSGSARSVPRSPLVGEALEATSGCWTTSATTSSRPISALPGSQPIGSCSGSPPTCSPGSCMPGRRSAPPGSDRG